MARNATQGFGKELRPARRASGGYETNTERPGKKKGKMTLTLEGDRHVVVKRRFAASPEAVYRAHTEPALIQKWMLGPDGWTMPVCINDAKSGGKIRYEWKDGTRRGFYLTGEFVD